MGVRWAKGDEAQGTHLHASTATMIPPLDNCSSEAFLTCLARSKPRSLDHCSAGALLACQTRSLTCLLDHCNTEAFLLTTRLVLQNQDYVCQAAQHNYGEQSHSESIHEPQED